MGGAQGLGFAMQDSRPENLDPPTHTVRLGSPLLTRDEEGDRRPSYLRGASGPGWIRKGMQAGKPK